MSKKLIKSLKELQNLNRKELFDIKDRKDYVLKKDIEPKFLISIAKQVSDGFKVDLRKQPSKYMIKKAKNTVSEFYDGLKVNGAKLIRPSKKNRKIYAKATNLNKNFKVFPISVKDKDSKVRVKKGKLIVDNKYVDYIPYYFEDLPNFNTEEFMNSTFKFTKDLIKEAKNDQKSKDLNFKIITGRVTNMYGFQDNDELKLKKEIERLMTAYENSDQWLKGIMVMKFKKQNKTKKNHSVKIKER